ncbi:zinc-binding alcohol dehydrogenase family protein [Dyadobacter sp. NIV53]|uniref:zinc-binding alcohol dehydrogenase family protein n=1 Tax=Dyadobacter sp. NIV53 TaxID=2861765 RepID=UPI001C86EBA1|nr:zinc-binding alcohol dehydrogenase family protein [Dyadobacter sp. NIV53]
MKILQCTIPGKFEYKNADYPQLLEGTAIIRIRRIGICGTDLHAFQGSQPFFDYPRILGHELAGDVVEYNGDGDFKPGDIVTIIPYFNCGKCIACRSGKTNCCAKLKVSGVHIDGGMTEYLRVPAYSLVHNGGLSYDELALVEPLSIGAHGVRRTQVKAGEFILVVGAGPIGLGCMEFARIQGGKVIALDVNEQRLDFCQKSLGVDYIINARSNDVFEQLEKITNGDMPTVIMDATGNLTAINNAFRFLAHGGRYILVGLQKGDISFSHPEFHKREATLMSSRNATRADFEYVMDCMRKGLIKPETYITHRTHFDRIKSQFESWLDPANGTIKAIVEVD